MREHHPLTFAELAPSQSSGKYKSTETEPASSKQAMLEETITRSAKYLSDSVQAKELNCAITYYIAKDSVPISSVEKPGFKHMVSKLNSRYQIPSRRHFSDFKIPRLYFHINEYIVGASLMMPHSLLPLQISGQVVHVIVILWARVVCLIYTPDARGQRVYVRQATSAHGMTNIYHFLCVGKYSAQGFKLHCIYSRTYYIRLWI